VSAADLGALLDGEASPQAVAALLDGHSQADRYTAIQRCDLARLGRLWELAAENLPIDDAHFVGEGGPLEPVAHDGWNSLPLPASARRFQKVFCRPTDGSRRIWGYNEGDARWLIGPGYFQLVPTEGEPEWAARGAWVVDYHRVPDGPVPEKWPKVVPNWWGLQLFVYNGTRDFMRRVSRHVSIGKPWARGMELPFVFALCRRDEE
jgi:hypothetical protein